jgi:murein DD-endopeptidase MepM/ murein hydrolase activator NlpD
MANEHSIRVSAKGEFGQLTRGLKNLQGDLKGVLGEIDRGARKGGVFDETQLRALSVYKERFKSSLDEINREFEKQNRAVDRLHQKMEGASRSEKEGIQKTIVQREKKMDVLRRELMAMERLHDARSKEADGYDTSEGSSSGGSSSAPASSGKQRGGVLGGLLGGGMGLGKFALGLAGVAGIGVMAHQAYSGAYEARTGSLDLAQRMRGQKGREGGAYDMWNQSYEVGTKDKMGYTAQESWGFLDQYSRQAGNIDTGQQEHLMKFGRGYGLSTSEVAGSVGNMKALGGVSNPTEFADMIAESVGQSGMTPRILEVMETSAGLLANMNTTLKDTGAKQILAYQTTLDTIGMKNGMTGLTGAQGANVIGGLGGIFEPNSENWKWMGVQALQKHDPEKYGDKSLYDLEASFEDGLLNKDNLPAMSGYLKEASGGNEDLMKRMLQKWLQDGGYNATKTQTNELWEATGGLTAFDEDKMSAVTDKLEKGDATEAYHTRSLELGQEILDVNARFDKQLEELGQPLLEMITTIKDDITAGLEWFTENNDLGAILQSIYDFMTENWKTLATIGAVAMLGGTLLKGLMGLGALLGGIGKLIGAGNAKKNNCCNDDDDDDDDDDDGGIDVDLPDGKNNGKKGVLGGLLGGLVKNWKPLTAGAGAIGVGSLLEGAWSGWREDPDNKFKSVIGGNHHNLRDVQGDLDKKGKANEKLMEGYDEEEFKAYIKKMSGDSGELDIKNLLGDPNAIHTLENTPLDLSDLNEQGITNLFKLNADGTGALSNFNTKGVESLEDFTGTSLKEFDKMIETSLGSFDELFGSGDDNFSKLYEEGAGFLEGVFEEHKGFKDFFGSLWSDFMSSMDGLLGGGSGGGGVGGNYDVSQDSGVTGATLNSKLGGRLKGMGGKFDSVGEKYGIDPAFLASIAMHETGNGTSNAIKNKNNVGGIMGKNGLKSFDSVGSSIDALGSLLKRLYVDQGLTTVEAIQKKYAPNGADNDPTGLNSHWVGGVTKFLEGFGVSGGGGDFATSGSSLWKGWKGNVTSRFGDTHGRSHMHSGLDIDGEQGDYLDAVKSGTISKILHDDGSSKDKDGKMNSTSGGNTVMVKMADGSSYAYAHMSKINDKLKVGQKINAGDYMGNMGGDRGKAGSGYSTTGSHLHLGYYDKNGKAKNPENWLNGMSIANRKNLDVGDMDMGDLEGTSHTSLSILTEPHSSACIDRYGRWWHGIFRRRHTDAQCQP